LSVVISILVIAEPVEQYLEGSAAFVREVERSRGKRDIVFCRIGPDGEDVKYVSCLPEAFTPRFIYSYDEAGDCTDAVVIIKSKEMKFLSDDLLHRMKVLAEGKLGHRKVTALEVPPRPASEKRDLTRPQTR
jgi:hypothetical protein